MPFRSQHVPIAATDSHVSTTSNSLKTKTSFDNDEKKGSSLRRYFLCAIINVIIIACGYGSYAVMYNLEASLESSQYESLALQISKSATDSLYAKILSTESLAATVGVMCPNADQWPNCSIPMQEFLKVVDPIIEVAEMRAIAFTPIISPSQLMEFEAFAYDFLSRDGYDYLGVSDFGKGVYSVNASTGKRFHDVNGNVDGQYNILTPVIQIGNLDANTAAVMFNLYSQEKRITAIDSMITCYTENNNCVYNCTTITDIIHLVQDDEFRPAVLIIHPLVPSHNKTELVGLTYAVHNWDSILSEALPKHVYGIVAVLHAGNVDYSFKIDEGLAEYLGLGDFHSSEHSSKGRTTEFNFFHDSVKYSVTIYPTDEYVEQYHTLGPIYAAVISVFIIVASLLFYWYDHHMNRNAVERELVINTKRLFVRFISHEIRTPLNTVHLGLKLLAAEINDALDNSSKPTEIQLKEWLSLIADIEDSSDTSISVLNDLINYDKLMMGAFHAEASEICLWDVIASNVKPFYVQARHSDVTLKLIMEPFEKDSSDQGKHDAMRLVTMGDRVKLGQVVRNIVTNAVNFTPPNGTVTVTVRWNKDGLPGVKFEGSLLRRAGSVVMEVVDTGAGIPLEDQKNLFREGIEFNANQLQAGSGGGLGMWISKGIVDIHKGLLNVVSEGVGRGTTVRLELAMLQVQEGGGGGVCGAVNPSSCRSHGDGDEESCSACVNDYTTRSQTSSRAVDVSKVQENSFLKTVLVVDDSPSSRKMVCRLLKLAGYETHQACDGVECLEMFASLTRRGVTIDLILMDFEMPNMNGPSATKELRNQGVEIPILGVTGNVLQADTDFFLSHGANLVLSKPLTINHLEAALQVFNSQRRLTSDVD
jgi:signal transduction histidine kinase/CheY-like chemotaxis protein